MSKLKKTLTKVQAAVLAVIIIVAVVAGIAYYLSLPGTPEEKPPEEKVLYYCDLGAHWANVPYGPDPTFSCYMTVQFLPLIYDPLFYYDPIALSEGRYEVIPWLAESYEVSEDGLAYTIHIRHGVKFHHTGNEVTAEDVAYGISRTQFFEYSPGLQALFTKRVSSLESVRVLDTYTIILRLKNLDHNILEELTYEEFSVVEKAAVEEHAVISDGYSDHGYKWMNKECNEAGTGPYYIKDPSDFKLMEKYKLTRYDDYWGGPPELNLPKCKFKYVYLLPINEEADARMKLMTGDLDILQSITPETFSALAKTPSIKVWTGGGIFYMGLWMHCTGPLQDWRVRKAIKEAINYTTFAEDIMKGTGGIAQGGFLPGMPGYREEYAHYFKDANITGAEALLDEAGYTVGEDGWRFHIDLLIRPEPRFGMDFNPISLAVKDQLANVGIDVKIALYTVGEYYEHIFDPICPPMMWLQPDGFSYMTEPGWPWINDLQAVMGTMYFGFNETNVGWISTKFEEMYANITSERDFNKRMELWQSLDEFMLNYGCQVTLTVSRQRMAYRDTISGSIAESLGLLFPSIFYLDKTS